MCRQQDYDAKVANKQLPFAKTMTKYETSYKKVPWSYSADGLLRSGDSVMLKNKCTDGWLVMDMGDRVLGVEEGY